MNEKGAGAFPGQDSNRWIFLKKLFSNLILSYNFQLELEWA